MNDILAEKIKLLAKKPGVYIMKNERGKVIYVGKAINLKNRVSQYFRESKNHSPKVRAMVSHIVDFETIITSSEVEALILECNLIKEHRPKYNISLKDDKSYPYLKITKEEFPRVYLTRKHLKDGGRYFGPYTDIFAIKNTLQLIKKLFPIRSCRTLNAKRPCLEYHIKRCLAPCAKLVTARDYGEIIKEVSLFLEGKTEELDRSIETKMLDMAEKLEFEKATRLRDQLFSIRKVREKQRVVLDSGEIDVFAAGTNTLGGVVEVFHIRGGKLLGRNNFLVKNGEDATTAAVLKATLEQYYHRATDIPKEILISEDIEGLELLTEWLSGIKEAKVVITVPKRGMKKDLVDLALNNAQKLLNDELTKKELAEKSTVGAVEDLGRYLGMSTPPYRMECFDISHNQGQETVASMVVFENGVPLKSAYRRYKIRSTEGKPDDFQSMREVTTRRYGKKDAQLPDLIIIDGGKGQLSSALAIIRGFGHQVKVVGLAKKMEEIFIEGSSEPVILPRESEALYLIQRIRDEAHRFAITYHRKLRSKRNLTSILDHIEGIGPKRKKALLDYFASLAKIKAASIDELAAVDGINLAVAENIYQYFHRESY